MSVFECDLVPAAGLEGVPLEEPRWAARGVEGNVARGGGVHGVQEVGHGGIPPRWGRGAGGSFLPGLPRNGTGQAVEHGLGAGEDRLQRDHL